MAGKKTPGGAGTHTGHTGHTGARGHTDHTDEPHNHPPKPNDTPARPRDGRNRDRLNSRKKLVAIFHNLRLLARMNKPNYVAPAVGWNCEDNHVGVIKFGVADYMPRTNSTQISAPKRPELLQPLPEDEQLQLQLDDVDGQPLMLM